MITIAIDLMGGDKGPDEIAQGAFDAREALDNRLLTKVVSQEDLMPEAWRLVRQLAALEVTLAAVAKECLRRGQDLSLSPGLGLETRLAVQALG